MGEGVAVQPAGLGERDGFTLHLGNLHMGFPLIGRVGRETGFVGASCSTLWLFRLQRPPVY
jgi:hypothetical protein